MPSRPELADVFGLDIVMAEVVKGSGCHGWTGNEMAEELV